MNQQTAEEYLAQHNILKYMEDAVNQLLEYKDETPKIIPARFLSEYFMSVHKGTNILFRDYKYIHSTPTNRSCFIKCIFKCFQHIAEQGELLSVKEYHSMLCLLCADFPLDAIQHTARIVLMEDALDCLMSFIDFLYAFQIQFYYEEYANMCKEVYDHLVMAATAVVVPSPDTWEQKSGLQMHTDLKLNAGIQSLLFYEGIEKARQKVTQNAFSMPNSHFVHYELNKVGKTTFYGFLIALSKNEDINSEIGILPNRDSFINKQ